MWIEIFKAGDYGDTEDYKFPIEKLQKIVSVYNNDTPENRKAPFVKGHPFGSDVPAHGWVKEIRLSNDILEGDVTDLSEEVKEDIKTKRFRNVSVAIQGENLIHVGLLGAVLPRVSGLKPVTMSDEDFNKVEIFQTNFAFDDEYKNIKDQLKAYRIKEQLDVIEIMLENKVQDGKLKPVQKTSIYSMAYKLKSNPTITNEESNEMIKEIISLTENEKLNIKDPLKFSDKKDLNIINLDDRKQLHEAVVKMSESEKITYAQALKLIINQQKEI